MSEMIHLVTYASQPDLLIECSQQWTTPVWGRRSEGVYEAASGQLYTFDRDRVTCSMCKLRRETRVEVRFDGPGGWDWRPATIQEWDPLGHEGCARVVFDDPPTGHPSWIASPQNIRPL